MQVEVSFTETLSQKSEAIRKQTEPKSNCTVQPAMWQWELDVAFLSLTQSPSPATSFSQPQKNQHCCFRNTVQMASWPRKQASYGFDQLTTKGKKKGERGWYGPESN